MKVDWSAVKVKLPPECNKITPAIAFARGNNKIGRELELLIDSVVEYNQECFTITLLSGEEFSNKLRICTDYRTNIYDLQTEIQILKKCRELILKGIDPEQVYEIVDKARVLILNEDTVLYGFQTVLGIVSPSEQFGAIAK